MKKGCASSSRSSPSPAASAATARRKRRARSTKAANWATVLSHAFGAAFDNPDLIVAVVVGDGESETGPLATSWHSNKFLNPVRDGAVLPILHLNGYKINNPTLLARISPRRTGEPVRGLWLDALLRRRQRPADMHQTMAATLEHCVLEIRRIQQEARGSGKATRAALADDRAAQPQRLDRPEEKWTATRWKASGARTRCRWPMCEKNPEHLAAVGELAAQLQAGGAVRRERPA